MKFVVRPGLPTRPSYSHYKQTEPLPMHFKLRTSFSSLLAGLLITFSISNVVSAQPNLSGCGPIENAYGPFDYRTEKENRLKIVEQYHFTPIVESLISGSTGAVGVDLDYTLRASPNHHRALLAMVRLGEKLKSPQPRGARYSVECYFERALRFRPDDSTARMIYATFLAKNGRVPETIKQLELATTAADDNPFTHYNIGLIYFDIKNYDRALVQAHKAYGLGFEQSALRDQLKSAGKWKEPEEQLTKPPSELVIQGSADAAKPNAESVPDPNKPNTAK